MEVKSFTVIQVNDNFNACQCDILVELRNENSVLIEWFYGFEYKNDSWETLDIHNFITEQLK